MALFGGLGKRLKDGSLMDGLSAAQAALAGDYGGMVRINAMTQERKSERAKAEAEAAMAARVRQGLKARGYSDGDVDVIMADPRQAASLIKEVLQPRQFGPGGGSVATPGAGGEMQWQMAPSRHEYQGSVYDVAGGAPGAPAQVTPQHQGTQWVTPQPGTTAFGVNSFNGQRRGTEGPPPPAAGPTPGTVEDGFIFKGGNPADPNAWEPVTAGGAGSGQRGFPGPY